ncbi:MAG: monovalent cation/H(+) antiporter subunit G [Candidatus Micrarchaeota archaeon]
MITEISTISLFIGTALCCIGTIGILRMPDFMNRLHSGTIITTLGTFFLLIPVGLSGLKTGDVGYVKSAIILLVVLWLGSAIGSHAIARAMFKMGIKPDNLVNDQMVENK